MKSFRRIPSDGLAILILLLIPLVIFGPVTVGNRTLIPADNLFQWAPWQSYASENNAEIPHNELLSDLLLENLTWKQYIRQSLVNREIPLWNPYLFAGSPFLAAGQHSALYPFSLVFYIMPLSRAYGVFTVSQLFLAGVFMYLFSRVLGMRPKAGLLAAIIYQLNGYIFVSITFPMILAASAWLPFLLAMIELTIRRRPALGNRPATLPWVILGAAGLGIQVLAGHGENIYFSLLVMGLYSAWRLVLLFLNRDDQLASSNEESLPLPGRIIRPAVWLLTMVILGIGLGAIQFIPFVELVQYNFRQATASLTDVLSWSFPWRRFITFFAPNFFGNPSHHSYLDLFTWQKTQILSNAAGESISKIDWGMKNYVEGGVYLGIFPLMLAGISILSALKRKKNSHPRSVWFFFLLAMTSLTFIFPTGTYAIIHSIPIINQSHSPFRWVYPLSLSIAVLAGWGAEGLFHHQRAGMKRWLGRSAVFGGIVGIVALVTSRLFFDRLEPLINRLFQNLARAPGAFPDVRAFFSYEIVQLFIAAAILLASGLILIVAQKKVRTGYILAIGLVVIDLVIATWHFFPTANPDLLSTPSRLMDFLSNQSGIWRVTTYTPHGDTPLHANTPWLYNMQDIRGYDSIIPKQYVDYMSAIEPQEELLYNRVQPIKNWESLNSPLLDLLNVRFVVTSEEIALPKFKRVWEGEELAVYENLAVAPRAFTLPISATVLTQDPINAMSTYDPRSYIILNAEDAPDIPAFNAPEPGTPRESEISEYGNQQVFIKVSATEPSWLLLADSFFPGWKAYAQRQDCGECDEVPLDIYRANGNFRGVLLDPGAWSVRFKYSPMSIKLGLFVSFLAGVVIVFSGGVWLWRYAYRESPQDSSVRRVAKNSLAPMGLTLFNRLIDFSFAALMLRILGAENAGKYYVAINIAGWFEILANFGLSTLLTREVSKDKSAANRYLVNTTVLRLFTSLIALVPILLYVLSLSASSNPLLDDTTLAISLLIIGMIPGGVSTGLTALFYAYEKAEIPAAFTTVSTILKVSLGTLALLFGLGFVGLAAVSIIVNSITMILLAWLAFKHLFIPSPRIDWPLQREMIGESFPLMLNHLLATLFFKIDVLLLERFAGGRTVTGNTVVGWYSAAYKWVDALNIIPSFFTFALFPVISRQAEGSRDSVRFTYQLAVKLLVGIALPLAIVTTGGAHLLVRLLGGSEYLPHGAIALQLLIWSIPIGWINSITNYVLIALGQQRRLSRAFILGVAFNLIANIIFLPRFGYPAAAIIAIFSELLLLLAFYHYLAPVLGRILWFRLLWRQIASASLMGVITLLGWSVHWLLGLSAGIVAYVVALSTLGLFDDDEQKVIEQLIPERFQKILRRPFPFSKPPV